MQTKYPAQIVGNIGLFYVCYQLSRRGWNVMTTSRNAKGIDIVAYSPDASNFIGVQVKCFMKKEAVKIGDTIEAVENIIAQYWIIVNNVGSDKPSTFVMLPEEVKERAKRNEKDGKVSFWLEYRDYQQDQFREAWDRLAIR